MQSQNYSKNRLQQFGSYLFNFGVLAGTATLTFGLISCGGGGGGGTSNNSAVYPTISAITAIPSASGVTGIIAASAPQLLTINGANFASGVTVTVNNGAANYIVTSTAVPSTTKITAMVTVYNVPNDSYVTVTVQPASGTSISSIVGVAHAYKTIADIQTIFNNNNCSMCHLNTGIAGDFNTADAVNTLVSANSKYCGAPKLRVQSGDPRRASNVLIDVLKAKTPMTDVTCQMPRGVNPPLSTTDIDAIVDWIALGTN